MNEFVFIIGAVFGAVFTMFGVALGLSAAKARSNVR